MIKNQKGFNLLNLLLLLVIVGIISSVGLYVYKSANKSNSTHNSASSSTTNPAQTSKNNYLFENIVIIVEENKGYKTVMNASNTPYIHKLASTYSQANNYFALFHPSLPNYLAMTGGTNGDINNDCSPSPACTFKGKNIVDEIEKSNHTWKGYMESMPNNCSLQNSGLYAVRHNPFVYYKFLADNKMRCQQHVVPLNQLHKDLDENQLPNYSFIAPNLCNDMHDCSVSTGDKWLENIVPKILDSKAFKTKKSLLVVTWDEAEKFDNENQIPTIFVGPAVKRGYKSSKPYNHYSLLRTIEKSWGLPALTNSDKSATSLDEFFTSK